MNRNPDQDDDILGPMLREHLSRELDPVRGEALRAFEHQVTAPMRRRLGGRRQQARRRLMARHWRNWGTLACAMAACVAIGASLPGLVSLLRDDTADMEVAADTSVKPVDLPAIAPAIDAVAPVADPVEIALNDSPAPQAIAQIGDAALPRLADAGHTTLVTQTDAGPVTLDDGAPGRRIVQQKYEVHRYIDPATKGEFEYVVPTKQDLVYPVSRQ